MDKVVFIVGQMLLPNGNACAQRELTIAKMFEKCNFKVVLIGYSNAQLGFFKCGSYDCFVREYPSNPKAWLKNLFDSKYIVSIIEKYAGDKYILFVDYYVFAVKNLIKYSKKHSIKIIFSAEEWYEKAGLSIRGIVKNYDTNFRMKHLYPNCDNLICISKYLYEYYQNSVNNILQVPAIIDEDSNKWNIKNKLDKNLIQFIYAGSPGIKNVKERLDVLIDAFNTFTSDKDNYRLIIVGLNEKQLNEIKENNDINKNISLIGKVPHTKCLQMIANSNFSIIPRESNRKNNAGFPTKLSESLGCGTPVITTNISNVSEFISDYVNGFVVRNCTKNDFIDVFNMIDGLSVDKLSSMKISAKKDNKLIVANYVDKFKNFIERVVN